MTDEPTEAPANGYDADDKALAKRLVEEKYDMLLSIARSKRRRSAVGETMRTTDILHESFLKLEGQSDFRSDEHFMRSATLAMRHVIVDYARRKLSEKRGSGEMVAPIDEDRDWLPEYQESPEDLLSIALLLEKLELENPRWMRIVDARYFAGMTEEETAGALSLSTRTVRRDWQSARIWLGEQMGVAA